MTSGTCSALRTQRTTTRLGGGAWPTAVAPFDVHLVATGKDEAVYEIAESLAATLDAAGVEVIFDDRPKVSPGVKFGDAELIGVPRIVIVGRGAADGRRGGRARHAREEASTRHGRRPPRRRPETETPPC